MHRFTVTKRASAYAHDIGAINEDQTPSPAHLLAIGAITNVLHEIVMRCLNAAGQSEAVTSGRPFLLLEMSDSLTTILGLNERSWLMLELSGGAPTIFFEARDLHKLQRTNVADLQHAASQLHYHLHDATAFILLMRN